MTIQVNNDGTFELNSPLASYGGKWTRINDNTIKMTYLTPASKGEVQNSTLTYDNNTDTVMIDNNTAEALYRCQPKQ